MFRPTVHEDTPALLAMTGGTGLFLPIDLHALKMVLADFHGNNGVEGHRCFTSVDDGKINGFVYFGPAAMTDRTWYLWWIVVDKQTQAKGLDTRMLKLAEDGARAENGRLMIIETSSIPSYELTRKFYLKHSYEIAAVLKDYYSDGHDMVIFRKRLNPA